MVLPQFPLPPRLESCNRSLELNVNQTDRYRRRCVMFEETRPPTRIPGGRADAPLQFEARLKGHTQRLPRRTGLCPSGHSATVLIEQPGLPRPPGNRGWCSLLTDNSHVLKNAVTPESREAQDDGLGARLSRLLGEKIGFLHKKPSRTSGKHASAVLALFPSIIYVRGASRKNLCRSRKKKVFLNLFCNV